MGTMTYKRVTYRETAKGEVNLYGLVPGGVNARQQAESLLDHLRIEGGFKNARVFIDDRLIKRAYSLSLQNRDYFSEDVDQPQVLPRSSVPSVEEIEVKGSAAGLFGLRCMQGDFIVVHIPTKLIFYVATTRMDAGIVAREVSFHCRKGIDSQDTDKVRRALPTDYPQYLVERDVGDSYAGWSF